MVEKTPVPKTPNEQKSIETKSGRAVDHAGSEPAEIEPSTSVFNNVAPRFEYFDRYLAHWQELEVLDVGCGSGRVSELLARRGCRVCGVDPSPELVEIATRRATREGLSIDYQVGSPEELPYEDGQFDVVVCVDVLEHVVDVSRVVGEMSRVLQPGGHFLFDSINRTWRSRLVVVWLLENVLRKGPSGSHDWKMFIKPAELKRILLGHGFMDISMAGLSVKSRSSKTGRLGVEVGDDMRMAYLGVGRTPPGPPAV